MPIDSWKLGEAVPQAVAIFEDETQGLAPTALDVAATLLREGFKESRVKMPTIRATLSRLAQCGKLVRVDVNRYSMPKRTLTDL